MTKPKNINLFDIKALREQLVSLSAPVPGETEIEASRREERADMVAKAIEDARAILRLVERLRYASDGRLNGIALSQHSPTEISDVVFYAGSEGPFLFSSGGPCGQLGAGLLALVIAVEMVAGSKRKAA